MSAFAAHGVRRLDGGGLGEGRAALLLPAGRNGPAFIVTRTFDANDPDEWRIAWDHPAVKDLWEVPNG